ncbi:retrovirus-related pol polyprotein from transposon TNT 1-94 [Tanacetum coccineum]|uniref:Retrovirus-related pol polyprotein from transposon TNT 1-94 n=1 Tax=Tanacetum coccineum TaxID=301880 RepID=A0ABQ4Z932_9ASTR
MEAIRIFLAFATYMNFKVYQMDVKSAFLNGKLKEEVYVKQSPGFESSEFPDYVCKLDKALYGLKQAPKAWMTKASQFVKNSTPETYSRNMKFLIAPQSAKKQQSVAISSAEAEYVVAAGCCASIIWMKSQLSDYDIHYKMVPIFCDKPVPLQYPTI